MMRDDVDDDDNLSIDNDNVIIFSRVVLNFSLGIHLFGKATLKILRTNTNILFFFWTAI